ncbi:O-antigen ligase family protein [Rossellomorea arthrocnemi]
METVKNKLIEHKIFQVFSSLLLSGIFSYIAYKLSFESISDKKFVFMMFFLVFITAISAFFISKYDWEYILLYLFVATAFLNSGVLSLSFGPFSLFPYRFFFLLSFAVFAIHLVKGRIMLRDSKVKFILYFLYFWLGYGVLSLIWAESLTEGIKYLMVLFIGIMLVTLINMYFTNRLQYLNLFYIWVFMMVVLIGIGLWNHFTEQHLAISTINNQADYVQGIPTAVFVNQNDYATLLAISAFFFLSLFKYSKTLFVRLAALLFLFLSFYLIYVTSSRGSMLGLGIGIGAYIFLLSRTVVKKWILIFGGLFTTALFLLFTEKIVNIIQKFNGQGINPANMGSNDVRVNLTKNAFYFIAESFGFGVGAGNSQYYLEHFSKYFTRDIFVMHNWWLEIFTNFGLLIFVGYVTLFSTLITSFYRFLKKSTDDSERMITEALLFALITFIPASISPSSVSNLFYHWVLIAFSIGFLDYIRRNSSIHSRIY